MPFTSYSSKKGVTKEKWEKLFLAQDIDNMLNNLHKIEVRPGDTFMIYGGVPHAIGSGCFLMEVQEPTDYTMRVEKVTPAGLQISDELIHQGVGVEKMLDCFHYECYTYEEVLSKWKVNPQVIDSSNTFSFNTIFNGTLTDCFSLNELYLNGEFVLKGNDSFCVVVVYFGEGAMICEGVEYPFQQGDEIFLSAAIENVIFRSIVESKILLCYPPA